MKGQRTRNIYEPHLKSSFRLSRSKIELFTRCPLCFYLDLRLGIAQPPGYPFTLNSAVDHLLKKEFDIHRAKGRPHPLMEQYGVDAIPYTHPKLDEWRENFKGIQYHHEPTHFLVTGAVDDIWVNPKRELIVVDYKATSKDSEVSIDADWQDGYKRQIEVYQWLLRQNKFKVSDTGYFVYANGRKDLKAFDGRLEFTVSILPYTGSDAWVEKALKAAKQVLDADTPPESNPSCEFCIYRKAAGHALSFFE